MKLSVPDHVPHVYVAKFGKDKIVVTLQPFEATQTSRVFDRNSTEARQMIDAWLFDHEIPDRENFREKAVGKKMKKLAVLAALLVLLTVPSKAQQACDSSCDARTLLALKYMSAHFGEVDSALNLWIGKDYGENGRRWLERREHKFEQMELWAEKLPAQDRRAYLAVIELYEEGTKKAYEEWHTHKLAASQKAYSDWQRRCAENAKRDERSNPLPQPTEEMLGKW